MNPDSHKRGTTAHDNTRIMPLKTAMRLQATYIMQTLLMDIWNTMRRAQAAAKRMRDEEMGESSEAQNIAPPKRQRPDSASASSPAEVDRTLCCLHTLKPHVTPHGLGSGLPERHSDYSAQEAQLRSSAVCKKRLELASLPVDILRIVSQDLPTWDRMALRQTCKLMCETVSFGGIRLAYPMPPSERRLIPSLTKRPGLTQLHFTQTDEKPLRKREFKALLSRLGSAPITRRYSVQISVSAKVTTTDMDWLEQQFETKGFMHHIDSIAVHCHVADFQSAFPLVPQLSVHAQLLSERTCLAIRRGGLRNLTSLRISRLRDENDVQMAWVIADRSISPALRSLQLSAEKGTSIPVGCRRMHPDFSHLHHLSITGNVYLCINFIYHLLPLRAKGMVCCQELETMLDEYTRRKLEGRILALHGPDEANQHGFMFPYLQQ